MAHRVATASQQSRLALLHRRGDGRRRGVRVRLHDLRGSTGLEPPCPAKTRSRSSATTRSSSRHCRPAPRPAVSRQPRASAYPPMAMGGLDLARRHRDRRDLVCPHPWATQQLRLVRDPLREPVRGRRVRRGASGRRPRRDRRAHDHRRQPGDGRRCLATVPAGSRRGAAAAALAGRGRHRRRRGVRGDPPALPDRRAPRARRGPGRRDLPQLLRPGADRDLHRHSGRVPRRDLQARPVGPRRRDQEGPRRAASSPR